MTSTSSCSSLSIVAVAVLLSLACETRTAPRDPAPKDATVWRTLGTWSGRGNSQTSSFTVETGALRLHWETRNESAPGTGRFRVALHSAISGRPLQTIVDRRGTGNDTSYLEDDPRVSYLVIESQNVDWTATLEEASLVVAPRVSSTGEHQSHDLMYPAHFPWMDLARRLCSSCPPTSPRKRCSASIRRSRPATSTKSS